MLGETRGLAQLNLGSLAYEQSHYEGAETHWREALETLRQASSTEAANAVNNLAVLATIRGDFDQAWGLYEEVLGLDGGQPGP